MFGAPLGPFRLSGRIDQGGMGQVWHGVHVRSGLAVAVKLIRADRPELGPVFFDEVRAVARLDHPHIIAVLDCGRVEARTAAATRDQLPVGAAWMAMEYCSGGTLAAAPPADWAALRSALREILGALACAHARGVLHRDVTPDNILRATDADARPGLKLTDFGLGAALERLVPDGAVVGTPAYMAPEQFRRELALQGPWTDLYQLGCVAWTLTTGTPPYGSDRPAAVLSLAHQELDLPAFSPRFDVPAGFRAWLGRMLEKAPRRRMQNAADALTALATLEGARLSPGAHPRSWRGEEASTRPTRLVDAGLGLWSLRTPPLTGRVRERDRLWSELQDVRTSWSGRVALVIGPAGVGRSRLAAWIAERAHEMGEAHTAILHAGAAPQGNAAARVLTALLGVDGSDVAAVHDRARSLGLPPDAVLRALAPVEADAPGRPTDTVELACAACAAVASDRPLILVLDDAHLEPGFAFFAERLIRRQSTSPSPVLVVLTARPESAKASGDATRALDAIMALPVASRIELGPLSGADEASFLRHGLGLAPALAERVRERAAGNPAYAVQLIGEAVASGQVTPLAEGFEVPADEPLRMPEIARGGWIGEVERALQAVGARADGTSRLALEAAAVLGNRVDEAEWASVCQRLGIRAPTALVERLVRERLALPTRSDSGRTQPGEPLSWRFAHPQVRDALVFGAAEAGRTATLHRACASALSAGRRGQPGVTERIGRHLHEAGDHADAVGWLVRGARRQLGQDDVRGAAGLLALAERSALLGNIDPADERQGLVRVLRAIVRIREGDRAAGARELERVIDLAPANEWRVTLAEALVARADLHRRAGHADAALTALAQARTLASALSDESLAARAALALGAIANDLGETSRAAGLGEQACALARRANDSRLLAEALALGAEAALRAVDYPTADRMGKEALDLAAAVGHRPALGAAWAVLARREGGRGNTELAVSAYQKAISALEEIGSPEAVVAVARLAMTLIAAGRIREARPMLAAGRTEAVRHGLRGWLAGIDALSAATEPEGDESGGGESLVSRLAPLARGELLDRELASTLEALARVRPGGPGPSPGTTTSRAHALAVVAIAQWRALGDDALADALAARLAADRPTASDNA